MVTGRTMTRRIAIWAIKRLCQANQPFGRGHPPLWLRHFVPERLNQWLFDNLPICGCAVMWKIDGSEMSWFPTRSCWDGPAGREFDYCGRFQSANEVAKAIDVWDMPEWLVQFGGER